MLYSSTTLPDVHCEIFGRRCLTLPHPPECSTISAGRLSFRVRNGTGRFPTAINHRHTHQNNTTTAALPYRKAGVCVSWATIPTGGGVVSDTA